MCLVGTSKEAVVGSRYETLVVQKEPLPQLFVPLISQQVSRWNYAARSKLMWGLGATSIQ